MATLDAVRRVFVLLEDCGYAFSGPSVDRTAQAWVNLSANVSDDVLMAAAASWLKQDKYRQWPVPGSVLGHVEELVQQAGMSADEAWGHVQTMIGRHGTQYAVPGRDFQMHEDPALAERILKALSPVGGWRGVGMLRESELTAGRASFRKTWNASADRERVGRRLGITATGVPLMEVK